jgi:Zn-finger nucleic acid-binding protein
MAESYGRGLCCHEAGHAVVLYAFGIRVLAVRVTFSEEKGWYGATDTPKGSADHLSCQDRITILSAGKAAEEFFDCPAYEGAWRHDLGEIASLLDRNGIPAEQHWLRIDECKARAHSILAEHREQAVKLIDHLYEHGEVVAELPELLGRKE